MCGSARVPLPGWTTCRVPITSTASSGRTNCSDLSIVTVSTSAEGSENARPRSLEDDDRLSCRCRRDSRLSGRCVEPSQHANVIPTRHDVGMCMRCDGFSLEEFRRHVDLTIRVIGYLIQQVADDLTGEWTYTVGVSESWGRPDLLIVDGPLEVQAEVVAELITEVRDRGEIRPEVLKHLDVHLVPVHESHFAAGIVGIWEDRQSRAATAGDFLQIRLGPAWLGQQAADCIRMDQPTGTSPL